MDDIVIGIDLGTTNTCVSYYDNGIVKILENKEGGRITPSVVYFYENNGEVIVGKYAKKMSVYRPAYAVFEIKRLVGRKLDDPYVQNNLKYFPFNLDSSSNDPILLIEHPKGIIKKTPTEICETILSKIKNDVEEKLGRTIKKAVITVPAYFNVSQREATLAAGNQAGFTVLKLLNEPTAAALGYYFQNDCVDENHSLVYDLGGGTFDVAILKRSNTNIDIICVDGDSHLGGQDFDNLILDWVCKELQELYKYDPRSNRRDMRRLHNICEDAKKTLSVAKEIPIILEGFVENHKIVELMLTREQFEWMAGDYFQKTIDIVDNCLKSCKLAKSAIKEVILSGGSTRIPKIQQILSDYFDGRNLNKFLNPDECVAEGAALQAAMLSTSPSQIINKIQVTDVTPLSLGTPNSVNLMSFLIPRNTKIPVSQTEQWITVYNKQNSMSFKIYEGERKDARKNRCLGEVVLRDITPAPPGQCKAIFTMTLDQNGILTVTAKEKFKNNVKDLKVTYTRGHRSDNDVKNALKDAEEHLDEDRKFEKFALQKYYLLTYCIRAMYNLENKNIVDKYIYAYTLCQETERKAKNMDVDKKRKMYEMIEQVEQNCQSIAAEYNFEGMPIRP